MKLPKEIQNKQKSKPKRPQTVKRKDGGQQFGSRQMRRRMQQQGIDMDQIDATRVIIECPDKNLVISQPEVVLLKQSGQEIYQVIGSAEEVSQDELLIKDHDNIERLEEEVMEEDLKPTITESDIMLVAVQSNVSREEAEATLEECNGDIAKAILFLKNR